MHRPFQDLGDILARRHGNRLDGLAAGAEHDALLAVAGDIDRLFDADRTVLHLFPLLGLDSGFIWQFVVDAQEQLFTRDLGGEAAHRQVGDLVFRVEPRAGGDVIGEPGGDIIDAGAGLGGDHERPVEGHARIGLGGQRQQAVALDQINLVQDQDLGVVNLGQFGEDLEIVIVQTLLGIDQHRHQIGIMRAAPSGGHHGPVQPAAGPEDAGGVDEDHLALAENGDAAYQRAGRLHLVGDDGANQLIEQGRLARVGRADQRDEAGAGRQRRRHGLGGGRCRVRRTGGLARGRFVLAVYRITHRFRPSKAPRAPAQRRRRPVLLPVLIVHGLRRRSCRRYRPR